MGSPHDEGSQVLVTEAKTLERNFEQLQRDHPDDHWVLVQGDSVLGVFDSFETAIGKAEDEYGDRPYLLRQVKPRPLFLPGSIIIHDRPAIA